MLNRAKPLSNNNYNSWVEEGQRKEPSNGAFKSERSPTKTTLRRTEPYKMLKRATKPLRRIVLIEEGLAKRSKKQHSENNGQIKEGQRKSPKMYQPNWKGALQKPL